MKDTIVFCLKVDDEESYGEIANFIYKSEKKQVILNEEVKRISYKYYLQSDEKSYRDWAERIIRDRNEFLNINEPQNIRMITKRFEIIYNIYVSEKADIIDLCNLYLLKQHYEDLNLIILFPTFNDSKYYTISQFLYSVGRKNKKFYNECFFEYRGKIQRAQVNNIYFSRFFTPLQIVDAESLKELFGKCRIDVLETDELLSGAGKILCDVKKQPLTLIKEKYGYIFQKLDVLAFVLMCYGVCESSEELDFAFLERFAFQMQQYSNAIRQLAENIVFHSRSGCGIIAFRVHGQKSSYINEKYRVQNITGSCLEIIISDFCRDNSAGSISDNFVKNLEEDDMKNMFKGLQPRAFFDHNTDDSIRNAWEEFYRNPNHIGRHFGLRIFQSIVSKFNGMFGAESHSGYINMPGDSFLSYQGNESATCMPGTRYHIVFPIGNVQRAIKRQDLSLDSGINMSSRINDFLNFTVDEITLSDNIDIPRSQQQKNKQIRQMSDNILWGIEEKEKDIIYISLKNISDGMGEIIAKALVMALFRLKCDIKVVLYECAYHLKKEIFETMTIFFYDTDLEGMFFDRNVQLIMYSKDFEETVLDLSSSRKTDNVNAYISYMKCVTSVDGYINNDFSDFNIDEGVATYIPCDVLCKVEIGEKKQTLFEHYTEGILKSNIQKSEFGCQLEHTHMRLGSTIHIDKFYEAEILFGNKLFVSRFALLLVKDMKEDIKNIEKLTLYGYGTYSETVLVQMIEMIRYLYPKKKDVDYIILEREEERRGFLHKDRIRYNQYFSSKEERVEYFKDRKVAIVVLINSTLKTHMRLINLFKEENGVDIEDCRWLIKNYAVLLVGNVDTNSYWKLDRNEVVLFNDKILPIPKFFIQVDAEYKEPSECVQCFPNNPVAEVPLIEVNAASTIPNQAFGIVEDKPRENLKLTYEVIESEEKKLECLKNEFIYGHVHRNENHFLYYFKTENICVKQKDEIKLSLKQWKDKQKVENLQQYNIIVAPMHFSNAGFVELVNNVVFDGNAILLRIDFDKEYRCNAYTKYSYLRNYIEQLSAMNFEGTVHVHFVDDAIISGRTFHRAKSLIKSILNLNDKDVQPIKVEVFDKVFVLVDRNSYDSRNQYVDDSNSDFFAFATVYISSLRNYADSCVYCNLKKEADLLFDTASTKSIAEYWKHCGEKFQLYSLEEYCEKYKRLDYKKQFRRLFCTHMAQYALKESYHGNDNVQAIYLILKLLNTDYESRKKDKYEYFLSYLKCISRPFLVFKKVVKEAIFDIMLVLLDAIIYKKKIRAIVKGVESYKPYLADRSIIMQFNRLNKNIIESPELSDKNKRDIVNVLMKQLTELKSNYIIRPAKMDAIFAFMKKEEKKKFEKDYMQLIDRLVGASSDTNKSVWLDNRMINGTFSDVSVDFRVGVILENTRAFRDGIEKLYTRIYEGNMASRKYKEVVDVRINSLEKIYDYRRTMKMFGDFEEKYQRGLKEYRSRKNLDFESTHDMEKKIKRFLKSLPDLPTMNIEGVKDSLKQSTDNWADIFYSIKEQLEEENVTIEKNDDSNKTQEDLKKWLEIEADMYQYSNFYKLLQEEGYFEEKKLSAYGADMIACCVKVLELCRRKDTDVLKKIQLLAILFKIILHAQKVQFIIENKADSNLDEWKQNIEKEYNAIVDKLNADNELDKISIKGKKHYLVIVEKAESGDYNTEVSDETEKLIENLEDNSDEDVNYIFDKTGIILWKLENEQRSIWINIENNKWQFDNPEHKVRIARDVRKIMMFYRELMCEIFNPENDDYINEISHARKELSIYNSNKVYTHTKDYSREILFDQAQHYFRGQEKNKLYMQNYPSQVLKLLADINISQYYRYGLKANFYQDGRGIKNPAKWNNFSELIRDGQNFTYCINKEEVVIIRLEVSDINQNDEILCKNSPGSIREMAMLIYAIILNAAEQNRGKRQNQNEDIQPEGKSVIVKIYKDNGYMVVENECEGMIDIDQIRRKLHHIPDSEDDGISLWSFNCYIRRCINSLILAKLKEIECNISENQKSISIINEVEKTAIWINKLTGDEYEIWPELDKKENGEKFFRVKIPIFMEKYFFEEKGEKNE